MVRRRFTHLDPENPPHDGRAILKWGVWDRLLRRRRISPPGPPAPRQEPDLPLVQRRDGPPRLTWIGHASFVATLQGRTVLVDPVFSGRVGWVYRRYGVPGLEPHQLPHIDLILVTHNHYDHLDTPSLRAIDRRVPALVPLGLGRWFRRYDPRPVQELGWWDSIELAGLRVSLVPARHWSRRGVLDTNRSLWGGYVIEGGDDAIYVAGDTAWFEGFAELRRRFPDLLAAVLPIGGYSPPWFMEKNHMSPEQAGRAFFELGARHLVPIHWGAFQLTDEPLCEPADRMRAWWQTHIDGSGGGRRPLLHLLAVGETAILEGSRASVLESTAGSGRYRAASGMGIT